jgi:O-antigen/teichoic acid export membrane protein
VPDRDHVEHRTLPASTGWTLLGNVYYGACQWGLLIMLARWGTQSQVGRFALSLAITAPIILALNVGLRTVVATDATSRFAWRDAVLLRYVTSSVGLVCVLLVAFLMRERADLALVLGAIGLAKMVESLSDLVYGRFQRAEKMDRIAVSQVLKGTLSLIAFGGVFYITRNVGYAALALAGAWTITLLGYDKPAVRRIEREARAARTPSPAGARSASASEPADARLRPLWLAALPLGAVAVLVSLTANVPRYFVEAYLGSDALGVFAALSYFMVVGGRIMMSIGEATSPRLAVYYAAGETSSARRLMSRTVYVAGTVGLGGLLIALLVGHDLLRVVYGTPYAEFSTLFTILMMAAGIGYVETMARYGLSAARRFRPQVPSLLASSFALLAGLVILLPAFGLIGAAMAILFAEVVRLAGTGWSAWHAYGPLLVDAEA